MDGKVELMVFLFYTVWILTFAIGGLLGLKNRDKE